MNQDTVDDPAGAFWAYWHGTVRPRIAPINLTAFMDRSRALAVKAAKDNLGPGDPATVHLGRLYGACTPGQSPTG